MVSERLDDALVAKMQRKIAALADTKPAGTSTATKAKSKGKQAPKKPKKKKKGTK